MADYTLTFQLFQIIKNSDLTKFIEIFVIINTMKESEINVFCAEPVKLPKESLFYGIKITAPTVFSVFVIYSTKMDL